MNATMTKKRKELERLYKENGNCNAKIQPKDQLRQRQATRSLSIMKAWNGEIRKLGRFGIKLKTRQVRFQHGEAHQNNGGKLGVVMLGRTSDFSLLITEFKVFSLTGNGDSLESDGECTQHTKRARNVTVTHR